MTDKSGQRDRWYCPDYRPPMRHTRTSSLSSRFCALVHQYGWPRRRASGYVMMIRKWHRMMHHIQSHLIIYHTPVSPPQHMPLYPCNTQPGSIAAAWRVKGMRGLEVIGTCPLQRQASSTCTATTRKGPAPHSRVKHKAWLFRLQTSRGGERGQPWSTLRLCHFCGAFRCEIALLWSSITGRVKSCTPPTNLLLLTPLTLFSSLLSKWPHLLATPPGTCTHIRLAAVHQHALSTCAVSTSCLAVWNMTIV